MIRRPPRSTLSSSSAASDVYKRQVLLKKQLGRPPTSQELQATARLFDNGPPETGISFQKYMDAVLGEGWRHLLDHPLPGSAHYPEWKSTIDLTVEPIPAPPALELVQSRLNLEHSTPGEFGAQFDALVPHGCNGLNRQQFGSALPELARLAPLLGDRLFRCFDRNSDGEIDRNEFVAAMTSLAGGDELHKCRAVFSMYDADGDGVLTRGELEAVLRAYFGCRAAMVDQVLVVESLDGDQGPESVPLDGSSQAESQQILTDFVDAIFAGDSNEDQVLSFEEFQVWLHTEMDKSTIYGNEATKWVDMLVNGLVRNCHD
eukprot:TRINITY_DN29922_c0_g1_i1.p1 TRINITY_DN29922_c0_g1~~TRINITY_DN29922_c0_g1_i1.p1  ORF type:complete len:317 (+),score=95.39 TRINITY_DN29922_c0_g1_i1:143-1093(+)